MRPNGLEAFPDVFLGLLFACLIALNVDESQREDVLPVVDLPKATGQVGTAASKAVTLTIRTTENGSEILVDGTPLKDLEGLKRALSNRGASELRFRVDADEKWNVFSHAAEVASSLGMTVAIAVEPSNGKDISQ